MASTPHSPRDEARLELLLHLKELGYRFTAVTPATHARVLGRRFDAPPSLRDIFGWSRPFGESEVGPRIRELMDRAGILEPTPDGLRSTLRVASLGEDLFYHSAYPTDDADAVFFGPDTYRFARFIARNLPPRAPLAAVDMGSGAGAGGICLARRLPEASVTLVDMNPAALDLARMNARANGVQIALQLGRSLPPSPDLVVANPPYILDGDNRAYRDGGELFGGAVALEWTRDALAKLAPGGILLLYTGAAIVKGGSPVVGEIAEACRRAGASLTCEEADPDVFGEELSKPGYAAVERIAVFEMIIRVPH